MADLPDLFDNPDKHLKSLDDAISNSILASVGQSAVDGGADGVQAEPHYLSVTAHRAANHGLLDLKPYFETSKTVKTTKDGGWYVRVPIRRTISSMSNELYTEAKAIDISAGQPVTTQWVQSLYGNGTQQSDISLLNYAPKSNNLTRQKQGNGSIYIAYRTVSNNSDPASWILNRAQATEDNMSKTLLTNLRRLIKYRLAHLNG